MQFAEITEDPFTNGTNNFFLVLDIASHQIPNPSAVGAAAFANGNLLDPNGEVVGYFNVYQAWNFEVTGSLSDEAYSNAYASKKNWMFIPPKFQFSNFGKMIGFWLSPKEVEQFILGRLSLKGGD